MSDKKTTGIDWVFEWQKEGSVAIRAAGFIEFAEYLLQIGILNSCRFLGTHCTTKILVT